MTCESARHNVAVIRHVDNKVGRRFIGVGVRGCSVGFQGKGSSFRGSHLPGRMHKSCDHVILTWR